MENTLLQYIPRLVFALFVGGLIGIEREIKGKPAGMRTNMLMCMGTCVLMILSIEIFERGVGMGDPSRIASQVMTGIGFLGAGMIIQSRLSVMGLTSAATLWFVAAIGLVIGWGDYILASASTILIIVTLTILSGIEQLVAVRMRRHILQFRYPIEASAMKQAKKIFASYRVNPENLEFRRGNTKVVVDVEYVAPDKKHGKVVKAFRDIENIEILVDF
ncbi:MAG: MgtC/SapB family protein [Candidatus Krumholzibacteriia bacterium]